MAPNYTLAQMRYFAAVAEHLNMTKAARSESVAQSTLSAAIAHLERELGVELFARSHRRGLSLTEAGRRLAAETGAFLEAADRLAHVAAGEAERLDGSLTVGMFAPLAPFRAPDLLAEFEAAHPKVSLTLFEGDQSTLISRLGEGRIEVALMYDIGLPHGFEAETLETIPPHVIVPSGHRLAGRESVRLAELIDDPLVLLDLPHTREYFLELFATAGLEPNVRHRVSGYETVRAYVGGGHGYSLLNQRIRHARTAGGGTVVPLELEDELPGISVQLVFAPSLRMTRRTEAFVAVAREYYRHAPKTIGISDHR